MARNAPNARWERICSALSVTVLRQSPRGIKGVNDPTACFARSHRFGLYNLSCILWLKRASNIPAPESPSVAGRWSLTDPEWNHFQLRLRCRALVTHHCKGPYHQGKDASRREQTSEDKKGPRLLDFGWTQVDRRHVHKAARKLAEICPQLTPLWGQG